MKKKFKCEVDCAACAAKIETVISKLEGVEEVSVNFLTQKFTLAASDEHFEEILRRAIEKAKKVEPDFAVYA